MHIRAILLLIIFELLSCNSNHQLHKTGYYRKMGEGNATDNGYHSNEANRLLEFNEINKDANEKHAADAQEEKAKDLNTLNKPNKYNTKTVKKKKKRFSFYH